MPLFIANYIQNFLNKAKYEYDNETKSWCANVKELPGAYAQADTVEAVRNQLAEVIEDYILVSLYQRHNLPAFKNLEKIKTKIYA